MIPHDEIRADTLAREAVEGDVAERVGTDAGDERDVRPESGSCHGLIGTLAARGRHVGAAQDRLSRCRYPSRPYHQVRVGASDDDDAWSAHGDLGPG